MITVCDLDGTISADPEFYRSELRGLTARGHAVHVVTGNPHGDQVLSQLGFAKGLDYTKCVTVPRKHIGQVKVAYMREVGATHIVDNRKKTIKLARKAGFTGHWHAMPKES